MKDDHPTAADMLAHINDDGDFEDLEQIRDTAVKKTVRGMMLQRTKTLIQALENGHDGVDFVPYAATQAHELDPENPVKLTEQARPWRGGPPDPDDYPDDIAQVNRVDFREHPDELLQEKLEAEIARLEGDV